MMPNNVKPFCCELQYDWYLDPRVLTYKPERVYLNAFVHGRMRELVMCACGRVCPRSSPAVWSRMAMAVGWRTEYADAVGETLQKR